MTRKTPTVWVTSWGAERVAEVQLAGQPERSIRLDSPSWLAWLEAPSTVSFAYPIYDDQEGYIRGFMTVRKERRARGSHYWVAYRRTSGRLRKIYLGRVAALTQQRLATTAERFVALEAPPLQGTVGMDGEKEVMTGQHGGASLGREAMMSRLKRSHQVVHLGRL